MLKEIGREKAVNSEQLNEVLKKINGVLYSKIKEENNQIEEVHIVASKDRSAKQIVRDVESILLAMFDYPLDRKVISIAQLDMGTLPRLKRVKYEGMAIQVEDKFLSCEVRLSHDGEVITASRRGSKSLNNRYRVLADATVKAIEEILPTPCMLDVQDVYISSSKGVQFVCVLTQVSTDTQDELLIGSAIVRDDTNEAVVRATLDALNRKLFQ